MKLPSSLFSAILLVMLSDPSGLIPLNVAAHGSETPEELAFRDSYIAQAKRSLDNCAAQLYARDRLEKRHNRRSELVQSFVESKKRDGVESKPRTLSLVICKATANWPLQTVNLNPDLRKRDLSDKIDLDKLFPDDPPCILTPELTIGPYCMSIYLFFFLFFFSFSFLIRWGLLL